MAIEITSPYEKLKHKKSKKSSIKKTLTLRDTVRVTALNATATDTTHFFSYCKQREFNLSSFVTSRLIFLIWDEVFKNGSSKICGRQLNGNVMSIPL